METAWANDGQQSSSNAIAGPSNPVIRRRSRMKATKPFVSANHKPAGYDNIFRVVIITSGSVASVKLPLIVGELSKNERVDVQIIGTDNSRHFYTQEQVDEQVRLASEHPDDSVSSTGRNDQGVRIWQDSDEWSDWTKLGDPILHIELRRWADLVVVAPCSANFLAKLAAGMCDNLPLSLLRALPRSTPVIICPAMNTHMYSHPFTAEHLESLQRKLGYLISGPQGAGMLACGDEGPGKMTDWRDIVSMIETFAQVFHRRQGGAGTYPPVPAVVNPPPTRHSTELETATSAVGPEMMTEKAERAEEANQKEGYTGQLGDSRVFGERGNTQANADSSALQWRDIWPE